jgi:hypothetical protein
MCLYVFYVFLTVHCTQLTACSQASDAGSLVLHGLASAVVGPIWEEVCAGLQMCVCVRVCVLVYICVRVYVRAFACTCACVFM